MPEIDAAELPADWVPRIRCENCGYVGKVLLQHVGYRWWMLALLILLFPAGLLGILLLMIVGNSRYKVCPKCGCDNKLKDATGEPTAAADLVWQVAHDADAEAFRRNKLYLLLIALASFAFIVAALVYFNWHWFSGVS